MHDHVHDHVHDHDHDHNATPLDLNHMRVISALGRGARGVVFLAKTESGESIALKAILRASIEKNKNKKKDKDTSEEDDEDGEDENKGEYKRIRLEQQVLSSLHHPLLPELRGVISTDKIVGYAIDYCSGGDLNSLRNKQTEKMFSDDIIRFYAAEMVLALEYLHKLGIVYRDLKPENVMVQENGHLMLVDFDLSTKLVPKAPKPDPVDEEHHPKPDPKRRRKRRMMMKKRMKHLQLPLYQLCNAGISQADLVHPAEDSVANESDSVEKTNSFVGTEEYVAPEVIIGNGHDFAVDWWCLGVMLYEMLYGKTPFRGTTRKDTFYRILTEEPKLTGERTPLRDLIKKLLDKDPKKRISVEEIKKHFFFKDVEWNMILEMARPPFIPDVGDVDGSREIDDVEGFVQSVFMVKKSEGSDEKIGKDEGGFEDNNKNSGEEFRNNNNNNTNTNNNNNNVGWVNGLNHPTQHAQNDNFLVF